MPIISKVGRKSANVVVVIVIIYVLLGLGSITMLYPFGMMLTASISSRYDYEKYNPVPDFLGNEKKQFAKFLFEKYSERYFDIFASTYKLKKDHASWRTIAFDPDFVDQEPAATFGAYEKQPAVYKKIALDFSEFKQSIDPREIVLYDPVEIDERYWRYLEKIYMERAGGDAKQAIIQLRTMTGLTIPEFRLIYAPIEVEWIRARWFPSSNVQYQDWVKFKAQQEKELWCVIPADLFWQRYLNDQYGQIAKLNEAWGLTGDAACKTFWEIPFQGHKPNVDNAECRANLAHFLRTKYPKRFISLSPEVQGRYHDEWIAFSEKREADLDTLVEHVGLRIASRNELLLPATWPANDYLRSMWVDFLLAKIDPADYTLYRAENAYREFLLKKYGSLEKVNAEYGTKHAAAAEIAWPAQIADVHEFKTNRDHYFWHYMARNYTRVFDFLVLKGQALVNTLVLVALTLIATLTVNPMAAYALSRYSMKNSHRILIFFLATMAFPPGVTMIPNFLLMRSFPLWQIVTAGAAALAVIFICAALKRRPSGIITTLIAAAAAGAGWTIVPFIGSGFHVNTSEVSLLNTYAALIVPGLANGFSIFLLKGFFDSLPRELFEAGMIDGASEFTMFRMITIPLCKPILAVIALGAFAGAYSGFMWAFIVCQKESMWTIMVWLYQFQMRYTATEPWLVMASLVVVSVPTLLMFLFCQRIILRGIIIPQMK